ncbi:MAG: hypothetical protein OIF54_00790, partial [Cohaesibacter sp.]|nr:hypothetical protein [Cohaesibacter sp.]
WNRLAAVFIALPLLSTVAGIITGFAQLVGGLMLLGSGIAALSLPVIAVIAGVAALAAAAYLIYDNWDAVVAWFGGIWDWIVEKAGMAWSWFKENLSWHPLALIANNWDTIKGWFSGFWESLKSKVAEGWEGIKSLLKWHPLALIVNNWSEISDWFSSFWETLKSKVVAGWEGIKSTFSFEWPDIPLPELPDLGGMIDSMADKAGAAWNRVTSLFSSDDPVTIAARDPASIERAQAAAQGLKS